MRRFPDQCLAFVTLAGLVLVGCEAEPGTPSGPADRNLQSWGDDSDAIKMLDMDEYAWKYRPLLVFARTADVSGLAEQRAALNAERSGLVERDMVVIEAAGDELVVNGQPREGDLEMLRKRYGVAADAPFAVLLIGKDTGVKLRRDTPLTTGELFGLVDSMPMRQREMREAGG